MRLERFDREFAIVRVHSVTRKGIGHSERGWVFLESFLVGLTRKLVASSDVGDEPPVVALVVLGGIYLGWFTPTESAGIGLFLIFVLAIASRGIGPKGIFKSFSKDTLELEEAKEGKKFRISPDLFLLRRDGSHYFFASHVYLLAGDEVRITEREGEARLLEVTHPSHTNTAWRVLPLVFGYMDQTYASF